MKPHLLRNLASKALALTILAGLSAGCVERPGGRIAVEGTLAGTDARSAAAPPVTLRLTHQYGTTLGRVAEASDPGIDVLQSMSLKVATETGGPFADEFVLAAIVGESDRAGGGAAAVRYDGDDPDWVRRRHGQLALLRLPAGAAAAGRNATRTLAPGNQGRAGAAWLVRLETGDPVIPWTIDDGDARCRVIATSSSFVAPPLGRSRDCLDLRSLAGMVLAHVAKTVTEALDDGPLPAMVAPTRHDLFAVPSLNEAAVAGGAGFGFIYSAGLRIGEGGNATEAVLHVPVAIHVRPAAASGGAPAALEAVFTPLGAAPPSRIGVGRVTVAYRDGRIGPGLAGEIRSLVVEALGRATLPPLMIDGQQIPAGQAIGRMMAAMAPATGSASTPYPQNIDVVALPVNRAAMDALVPTLLLSLQRVSTTIASGRATGPVGSSQPARPTAAARADGSVTVTSPLDPPGSIRRITTLSPVQAGEPYELRLSR